MIKEEMDLSAYTPHGPISIYADGDFGAYSFPGDGSPGNPYRIENYSFVDNEMQAIWIDGVTKYFIIQNCYFSTYEGGIDIRNLEPGIATIHNNTLNVLGIGIVLINANNSVVSQNIIDGGGFGAGIEIGVSSQILVTHNLCQNNNDGISLYESDHNNVTHNECYGNGLAGIIQYFCHNNLFEYNIVQRHHTGFLAVLEGNSCIYRRNLIIDNFYNGIHLESNVENNQIYYNAFINNRDRDQYQAVDQDGNNLWYDVTAEKGNYWDHWDGSGSVYIYGPPGNEDPYPINDTDDDGMNPSWEVKNGLDIWFDDSGEDPDDDGLTNFNEYKHKSDPWNNDTDDDGLEDGEEVYEYKTNPKQKDTDADGLEDGDEVLIYLTDPNNNDTDGDGISDGEEIDNAYDPLDPDNPYKSAFEFYAILVAIVVMTVIFKKKRI